MPQSLLPLFPEEESQITGLLSFERRDGRIYYFHGGFPVFSHAEEDRPSFRMFTSQLTVNGNCKQVDIVRAFGVSPISVKRYVKKYREGGPAAFFQPARIRGPHVLTKEVVSQGQLLLNEGFSRSEVAKRLGIKSDTLSKAIRSGRWVEAVKKTTSEGVRKANGVEKMAKRRWGWGVREWSSGSARRQVNCKKPRHDLKRRWMCPMEGFCGRCQPC